MIMTRRNKLSESGGGVLAIRIQVLVTLYETKQFKTFFKNMHFFTYKYCTYMRGNTVVDIAKRLILRNDHQNCYCHILRTLELT